VTNDADTRTEEDKNIPSQQKKHRSVIQLNVVIIMTDNRAGRTFLIHLAPVKTKFNTSGSGKEEEKFNTAFTP
tara:strand:- start:228 stop:446 length:219 start_codon:yes stop_codon:yes gene_type:complete